MRHGFVNRRTLKNTHTLNKCFSFVAVKTVVKKWRNIRDQWLKSNKKMEYLLKYSDGSTRMRPYIYSEQLSFLKKTVETTEDIPTDCSDIPELLASPADIINFTYPTAGPSRRRTRSSTPAAAALHEHEEDEEEERVRKIARMDLEKQKQYTDTLEDPKVMFFKGILPNMSDFTDDENLEFQSGVIQLIQQIRRRRYETTWRSP